MRPRIPQRKTDNPLAGIGSGLGDALFPKVRRKVLALFLLNPEKQFYFREAVRALGDAPGSLQRELVSLVRVGVLTVEKIGIQKFYRANRECPIHNELKSIAEKTFGIVDVLRDVLRAHASGRIEAAWVYGSIASGKDSGRSDIDLMVVGSISFRELVTILKPIEETMRRPVNPTLYSSKEFVTKLRDKNHFLRTVMKSEKVFVLGDDHDLDRLAE